MPRAIKGISIQAGSCCSVFTESGFVMSGAQTCCTTCKSQILPIVSQNSHVKTYGKANGSFWDLNVRGRILDLPKVSSHLMCMCHHAEDNFK